MTRRGLALVLVVGVLGVLAVLGSAFAVLSRLERKAASQRVQATLALLLARSGIEDALARISMAQDVSGISNRYAGEDWNGNGILDSSPEFENVWQTSANALDPLCPVRYALRPSFFVRDPSLGGYPALSMANGRRVGRSGGFSKRDSYAIRIDDESGKINVNGGFVDGQDRDGDGILDHRDASVAITIPPPGSLPADALSIGRGWNAQLARILGILGDQAEVAIPSLGALVLANRPRGGYRSVAQLQERIGTAKDLSPYLTTSGWIDTKVVHPNGYASQAGTTALSEIKKARMPLALEEGGRPPVNLNTAPKAVLVALIQGLEARSFQDPPFESPPWDVGYRIPGPKAAAIAAGLISARPFSSWRAFSQACDALVPGVINGFYVQYPGAENLGGADLLKANFNPNTQLAKELPDQLRWRWIDKSDLSVWSTEGCLGPTGTFRIDVVGRILGQKNTLSGEKGLSLTARIYSPFRQTSQSDFVSGRSPNAGGLSYLSLANPSPSPPIPPQRTTGASAAWNTWGAGRGLAAVTYPCAPTGLPGKAADYDGSIGLATVELEPVNPSGGTLLFLHHFDDSWDADLGSPAARKPGPGTPASDARLQTDVATSPWPSPPSEPGTLYPDGMHAQVGRSPAYQAIGNFPVSYPVGGPPSNHGTLSYWAKHSASAATRVDMSCVRGTWRDTQALATGRFQERDAWGIVIENRNTSTDKNYERQVRAEFHPDYKVRYPGLRWRFVTAHFDTDETLVDRDASYSTLGARPVVTLNKTGTWYPKYLTALNEDLLQAGQAFVLGGQEGIFTDLSGSNQVLDEFALCDFGDIAATALTAEAVWATERYRDGRYYKGGDGRFLSDVLQPDAGASVHLLFANWTDLMPSESRLELLWDMTTTAPPSRQSRLIDPLLRDRAWIEVELLDGSGNLVSPALNRLTQWTPIGRTLRGFRYRVHFRTNLADPQDSPILETPFFDDITFACQPLGGPRFQSWQEP